MAAEPSQDAIIVFSRFGLGARTGDLAKVGSDPRGFLKAELQPDRALIPPEEAEAAGLAGTAANIQAAFAAQEARKALRRQRDAEAARPVPAPSPAIAAAPATAPGSGMAPLGPPLEAPKPRQPQPEVRIYRAEALARFGMARDAEIGFLERLVTFWSNHFCVSVGKGEILRASAGSFEREAIRPHVLGRFADMLLAVERHPAMLFYLDNAQSVGPDSRAGQNRKRGLNENLAREIMELHTLGVDGGYTQTDVASLARVITGWTFAGREGRMGEPGSFLFNANMHEPGDQMVVGRAYLEGGFGQGEAALNDIARHPATARHIATKLVRHFIADEPPPAAVDKIAAVFRSRDGDLRAVSAALVDLPEAWSAPRAKIRNPYDFLVASARLLGATLPEPGPMLNGLRILGQPLWEPPGPNGYPDTAADWASPEGMKLRLDVSAGIAHAYRGGDDPLALIEAAAGAALSPETRDAIPRAESREQGLGLALMSPEFQRR
jgi:uncharacterized protein (DUF1800 family)